MTAGDELFKRYKELVEIARVRLTSEARKRVVETIEAERARR